MKGGVYLGVGPEQNFTYMAAIRPSMAFILDIRRQAVMQHLMFKAVFEFVGRSRGFHLAAVRQAAARPALEVGTPIQQIWKAFTAVPTDQAAGDEERYERIVEHLTKTQQFALTPDEIAQLQSVFRRLLGFGPSISTRGSGGGSA